MIEEDRVSKLPKNYEAKRTRQEWELREIEARKVNNFWTFLNRFTAQLRNNTNLGFWKNVAQAT